MPVRARNWSRLLAPLLIATVAGGCVVADPSSPSGVAPSRVPTTAPSPSPIPSASPLPVAGGAYLAIGDSVTFGIGVSQPRRAGFVAILSDRLVTVDPAITETRVFAVPGETAAGFLDRRLDDVLLAIEELGPRTELVTIGLGANELLRIRRDPACEVDPGGQGCASAVAAATSEAASALDGVVGGVQAALEAEGSDARVLVLAYYNPDVEPAAATTVVGTDGIVSCDPSDANPGLDDRIACVAESRGVELIDLYAAFLGREAELTRIAVGDVHPNEAGHEVIAEIIAAQLSVDR